ncbi:N-acetyltransferase 8-like 2 isoform X1 [Onychostoma macrolepis]|uniref:N-acetyltransferase 8-like 2 isoform X1 n=1 Tax=Onychostoma macrolepis TaxID=369639 RepID=UPI00272AFE70|nr:N-acetyltransferase 8-like 2 isoform X1 [Onychostoma macrolepis]
MKKKSLQQHDRDCHVSLMGTNVLLHFVIRRYQPSDREAVEMVFREGIMEHINPAFMHAMTRPLHITVSLFFYIGAYVMSGQSVVLALVSGGAWIGLVYFCCYEFYAGYVRARLNTDMLDIPGYYLSNPDNCFWVAEAEIHGRPQVLGMVAVEGKSDPGSGGKKYGELYRMIVSSTCRRCGLGVRLAKTAEDFCRERCFSKFKLSTTSTQKAAVALYFRLGFKLVLVHTQTESPKWMIWMTRSKILTMEKNIE